MSTKTRMLHLRTLGIAPRLEQLHGRDHLVVPVVALMEGVIHAVNAETPEYVTPEFLTAAAESWNDRPLVLGHPTKNGIQISAGSPGVWDKQGFGRIYNSGMKNGKLQMEAWADIEKLEALGQQRMLDDLRAGRPVEISVGANVRTLPGTGNHKGKDYKAKWIGGSGDHLAFLPNGRGACSVEMGCGACRAAEAAPEYEIDGDEFRVLSNPEGINQYTGGGGGGGDDKPEKDFSDKEKHDLSSKAESLSKKADSYFSGFKGKRAQYEQHMAAAKAHDAAAHAHFKGTGPEWSHHKSMADMHRAKASPIEKGSAADLTRHASNPEGINQYSKGGGGGDKAAHGTPHASRSPETNRAIKTVTQATKRGGNMADDYREHEASDFSSRFGLQPHEGNAVYNAATKAGGRDAPMLAEHPGATHDEPARIEDPDASQGSGGGKKEANEATVAAHIASSDAHKSDSVSGHTAAQNAHEKAAALHKANGSERREALHNSFAQGHAHAAHAALDKRMSRIYRGLGEHRAAALFDTPEQAASEEAAELVSYNALRTHLDTMGAAWDDASGLVNDLISDEEDDPTETPEQEEAEEEVETARLEALMSLLGSIASTASSAMSICMNLNAPDYAEPTPARYMEHRAAIGKSISAKNMKTIQAAHDAAHDMHEHTTALGAECDGMTNPEGDVDMDKNAIVKALTECGCLGFTTADVRTLSAMTDEQLTRLEARHQANQKLEADFKAAQAKELELKAAAEKKPTQEEMLAMYPAVDALVKRAAAQEAARKDELIGKLKTAQTAYTEDELKAQDLVTLEKIAKVAKVDEPAPNYSGRGLAARPDEKEDDYTPPDPYAPGLKALQGSKAVN
jgi:hypothetical protein